MPPCGFPELTCGSGGSASGWPARKTLVSPKFCQIETLLGEQLTREGNAASARTTQGTDECDFWFRAADKQANRRTHGQTDV